MHSNSKPCVANPDCAAKERCSSQLESPCPLRAAWTQSYLRVEKLDVRLIETRLLQTRNLVSVLAKHRRQSVCCANCLDE